MGRGTLPEVRDGWWDPLKGSGQVGGTLPKFRDRLRDLTEGTGWVVGPSWRFGMGHGTLLQVRDQSGDPQRGQVRVGGNLVGVRDGLGDLRGVQGRVGEP